MNKRTPYLIGGGVLFAAMIGIMATRPRVCNPSPFRRPSLAEVEPLVDAALAVGWRSVNGLSVYVSRQMEPKNEKRTAAQVYPPAPTDLAAVCFFNAVVTIVTELVTRREIPPWPACPPNTALTGGRCIATKQGIDVSKYEDPDGAPRHGTMFQVEYGDRILGMYTPEDSDFRSIAYAALYTAGYDAARDAGGLDDDAAEDFATELATNPQARAHYAELMACVPFNDALYQTYGYKQGKAWPGPNGRALRLLPHHFDNRARLQSGVVPKRNIQVLTPAEKGGGTADSISESEGSFEYLWLPLLNTQTIWEKRGLLDGPQRSEMLTTFFGPEQETGLETPEEISVVGLPAPPDNVAWGC